MASKSQADLESQKSAPPAAAVASAPTATAPASGGSVERTLGSVVVGISDAHRAAPETQPLLQVQSNGQGGGGARNDEATRLERAMAQAFHSTAELAKHLPTGAVLVFEVLSPVFTNGGKC